MLKKILFMIVGAALLGVLLILKFDFSTFISTVSTNVSWLFYFLISLSIIAQLVFRSLRFGMLFNSSFSEKIQMFDVFVLSSASFFLALATPNKLGDTFRAVFYKKQQWEITAISLIEFVMDIVLVLIIPLLGFFVLYKIHFKQLLVGYIIVALVIAVLLFFLKYSNPDRGKPNFYAKNVYKFSLLKQYVAKGLKSKFALFTGFLFTCLTLGVYFTVFYAVVRKLGGEVTFVEALVAAGVGVFIGSMSFIPMGIGTRDVSAYAILVTFGVNAEVALSSVVIIRSLSVTLVLVSCICYFIAIHRFGSTGQHKKSLELPIR